VNPIIAVGLFCGALTNTPSLAAAAESLKGNPDVALLGIGYSVAYPLGVILPILIAQLFAHIKGVDLKSETKLAEKESGQLNEPPVAHDFNIKKEFAGKSIEETGLLKLNIRISRLQRAESQSIPMPDTILKENDLVHLVGTEQSIAKAIAILGAPVIHEVVPMRRDQVDFRRILLTNKKLVGRTLAEAHLESDFGAVVTRVRRGDVDFVPTNDTVLERGDRLRLVAPTEKFKLISDYLGDSTKALSQIDYLSLSLGILIGIVIGEIEIPIGGFNLKLGLAGGPLLVALILGWRGRTGKIIWDMPIEINMTFRELGLVLFFAAVGLKSGAVFMNAIAKEGASLIFFGALITLSLSLIIMLCAMYLLKLDWVTSTGMMAGGQTQPAVLTFIGKLSHSEAPNAAYVSIMPVAMILKIIVAQILLWILLNQ
jgi:putative transport protein